MELTDPTLNGAARDLVIGEIDQDGTVIPLPDIGKLAASNATQADQH